MGVEFQEENIPMMRRAVRAPQAHILMKLGIARSQQQAQIYSIGIILVCIVVAVLAQMVGRTPSQSGEGPKESDIPNPRAKAR
jgi:hypothetical protein